MGLWPSVAVRVTSDLSIVSLVTAALSKRHLPPSLSSRCKLSMSRTGWGSVWTVMGAVAANCSLSARRTVLRAFSCSKWDSSSSGRPWAMDTVEWASTVPKERWRE